MNKIEETNEKIIKLQNENIVALKEIVKAKDLIIKDLKEQLMLGGVVGQGEQLCGCKEPKSDGWYGDAYMCKCGKIYIEE